MYHKWQLKLFAITNHRVDVSIYYKCIMSKRLRLVQRMRFLQIATKEDSRILKTKQNVVFFEIVQMHCFLVVLRKNL